MSEQGRINDGVWAAAEPEVVAHYVSRELRPAEVVLLLRHREALGGRVLELGSGAGRLTGYLGELSEHVHGVDLNPEMVALGRRRFPSVTFSERDLRDLGGFGDASHDVVVATYGVLGVLDDAERRTVLAEVHRILVPGGLLLLSAHNREHAGRVPSPLRPRPGRWPRFVLDLPHLPARYRNHRRLRRLGRETPGYAIVNDEAHDYALLHYYIGRDAQERQLRDCGFTLIECLDIEGATVPPGDSAPASWELHYAARSVAS